MCKELISAGYAKKDHVLANDVISDKGVLLAIEGTIVNEYMLNKFLEFGISQFWVYSLDTNENLRLKYGQIKEGYAASIKSIKNILLRISAGENADQTSIEYISDFIYTERNETDIIIKCLENEKNADEYTYRHCINVAFYSMLIAKWLKLDKNKMRAIIQAGLLHDVGKVKISSEILNKKGKLTPEEFEIIKNHSFYGYCILEKDRAIKESVKKAVLFHHERIDGSGYPFGIKDDKLDLFSRIIAIADVYDAMTTDRIYKDRVPPFDVFFEMGTVELKKYDSSILQKFLKNISHYYTGAHVRLSNNLTGEIEYVPPHDILHPVVRTGSCFLDLSVQNQIKIIEMI